MKKAKILAVLPKLQYVAYAIIVANVVKKMVDRIKNAMSQD